MTEAGGSQEPQSLDPQKLASVRRRLGFVTVLWWIAAIAGALGLLQGLRAGWVRLVLIAIAWVLAVFFTIAWSQLPRGRQPQ